MKPLPTKEQIDHTLNRCLCVDRISLHVSRLKQQDPAFQALLAAAAAAEEKYDELYKSLKARRDRLIDQAAFGRISAEELYTFARDFFDGCENGC